MGMFNLSQLEKNIKDLKNENVDVRKRAAEKLAKLGNARAVEPFIEALKDRGANGVHLSARRALENIGEPAVESLIRHLEDKNENIRLGIVIALGTIHDARAVKPLIRTLRDESINVRRCAAKALGEIGNIETIGPLVFILQDKEEVLEVKKTVCEALRNLGWEPENNMQVIWSLIAEQKWNEVVKYRELAIEPLIIVLKNSHEHSAIQLSLGLTLGEFGIQAVEPLTQVLDIMDFEKNPNEHLIEEYLTNGIVPTGAWYARQGSAFALGDIGDRRAIAPLIRALLVSYHLHECIQPHLSDALWQAWRNLDDALHDFQRSAIRTLGNIGDDTAVDAIIQGLKSENSSIRQCAAEALGNLGADRAMDHLRRLLADHEEVVVNVKSVTVAESAKEALDKIKNRRK